MKWSSLSAVACQRSGSSSERVPKRTFSKEKMDGNFFLKFVKIVSYLCRTSNFVGRQLTFLASFGRGGGQVVSVLAFYSDDPSSNPAEVYIYSVQFVFEMNENNYNKGRGWHIEKPFRASRWKYKLVNVYEGSSTQN